MNATAPSSVRSRSGFATPPGSTSPSYSPASACDTAVDRERIGLVEVVEGLHLAVVGREQLGRGAGLLDRLPRLGELHLLDALRGDEERDALAIELAGRRGFSFRRSSASFYPQARVGRREAWVM